MTMRLLVALLVLLYSLPASAIQGAAQDGCLQVFVPVPWSLAGAIFLLGAVAALSLCIAWWATRPHRRAGKESNG